MRADIARHCLEGMAFATERRWRRVDGICMCKASIRMTVIAAVRPARPSRTPGPRQLRGP